MIFGFYYRARRARLQKIFLTVGADDGRAFARNQSFETNRAMRVMASLMSSRAVA
jgi:hypothetical protein